jgi:hypothetical protein
MATNTYVELRTTPVVTATPSVTFDLTGITGYTDLRIVATVRSTRSALSDTFYMRLNGDTGSNYGWTNMRGDGSSATTGRLANVVGLGIAEVIAANQTAGIFNVVTTDLMNYSSTATHKTTLSRSSVSASYGAEAWVSAWRNTAAVTSMTLFMANGSNIEAGSTFSLYGISNVGDATPKATGGDVTEDATYWYHTFNMSGDFVPNQSLTADFLVIAGGGGGDANGGGGAGGYRTSVGTSGGGASAQSALSLTAQRYQVLVGAGGARATSGSASSFSSVSTTGGGKGGGGDQNGTSGGSGGGGGGNTNVGGTFSGGAGTTNEGFGGGSTPGASNSPGGGGGGAGGVGGNGNGSVDPRVGGTGGIGLTSSISGTSVGRAGGGAAGSGALGGTATQGGGAGASGLNATDATAGTVNTGGGGGGGGGARASAAGGSGVVIVRYTKA